MYCNKCGNKVEAGAGFCSQCGVGITQAASFSGVTAGEKEKLLKLIQDELAKYPQLSVSHSDKTDLEIKSVLADANWGLGKKKMEYSACLLAKEEDRNIIYWEMIKETSSGMKALGGFKVTTFGQGKVLFGKTKEVQYGPDGRKVIDYEWDYAKTRTIIENIAKLNGWQFKTVLFKNKATY